MKNVLLLSTGGTIASARGEFGLYPSLTANEIIEYVPELKNICKIECKTVFSLDSSNIQPEEWKIIAREVYNHIDKYDGIVILHGTDTMAYTASMLSFMLLNLNKPVILTGSQLPVIDPSTDAKRNLIDAFLTVIKDIYGVYIVFGGKVIRGCRAVKVRTMSYQAFESINIPNYGYIENGEVNFNLPVNNIKTGQTIIDDRLNPDVFLLKLIPGTRTEFFDYFLKMGYKGVVIEGFGLGGVHFHRRNLITKMQQLLDAGMAVVLTTQCLYENSDLSVYEVGRMASREGIIPGYDMTSEAAVTKLMWVLGHTSDPSEIKQMMLTNYCGEITINCAE